MKIPYNTLHVNGNVLFAARGGKLHSFSLDVGAHLSTWKHPDSDKVDTTAKVAIAPEGDGDEITMKVDTKSAQPIDSDEPPAKRQRVDKADDDKNMAAEDQETAPESGNAASNDQNSKGKGKGGKKSRNRRPHERAREGSFAKVPDRPVITHLSSTKDGGHLVAITGHDKSIWVFEHDGNGTLKELSKRTMPKRPSSVAIGPDSQIICADKFGDVYALPLLITSSPISRTVPVPVEKKPAFKPAANNLTVHSRRNLRALNDQQRQAELHAKGELPSKSEGPDFEITLLLGHVSMLTALTLGEIDGRRYILTADRDEHIRVSRYIPQAYVIEGFCLGHKEFVSALTIPALRNEVLVSGGGDEEIFVWDWKAGKLLSKTNLLSLSQEIAPNTTKIAVSSLSSLIYPTGPGEQTYILAICEDIPAIFTWQLTVDNTLNHPGVIQIPGNPLNITIAPTAKAAPRLIVALDPGETGKAKSLSIFTLTDNDGKLGTESTAFVADENVEAAELDITGKDVKGLLYSVETLRKQTTEQGEDAIAEEQDGEQEAGQGDE